MLQKNRLTLPKLISFVKGVTNDIVKNDHIVEKPINIKTNENIFARQNDTTFRCLNNHDSKITNDLPTKLRSYFDPFIKEFVRYFALTKLSSTNENISGYYSVLKLCIPKFEEYTQQQQIDYIKCLREKLIAYVSNTEIFKTNGYEKLKWNKKSIIQSLMQFKVTKITLKLMADYFSVNIFILNILEDKLYVISGNDFYDMFRFNVFMTLNNETFEPLTYLKNGLLEYNNILVKKIISIHKNIIILFNTNLNENTDLEFVIKLDTFNITIINKENEYDEILLSEVDENAYVKDIEVKTNLKDVKTNKIEEKIITNPSGLRERCSPTPTTESNNQVPVTGIVFNVSLKMKLDVLQDMATKLNIDINKNSANGKKKLKTKNELVDEINKIMLK